jgi:hypothetical protein
MARRPTEPTANPARGAALVVVAVLIGLFLLRNGLDTSATVTSSDGTASADGADGTATDEGTDAADEGTDSSVDDTTPPKGPSEVLTIVLNDSGVGGSAKKYSDALAANGYNLTNPTGGNATSEGDAPTTQVLYTAGFDREAAAVAALIGAQPTAVAPLGTAQPGIINGATVIVVLGTDLASTNPPGT